MREELNTNLGFYNSAFLKMHVHSTEDLTKLEKVSIQTEATYLHEYIHFLQDITSTYGLTNICTIVDYVKLVNHEAISDGKSEFIVPFQPFNSPDHDVKTNWELKNIYLGGGNSLNDIAKMNSICKCVEHIVSTASTLNIEKVVFDFEDSLGNEFKYVVGAYCVCENVAYVIENILYPGILPTPAKMPYDAIKIMSDNLLPGFSNDPLNILALCDASLLFYNPGVVAFDTLLNMKNNNFYPTKPEEVYDFVYNNIHFNFNGHTTIQQLLISTAAESISQLGDYFTTPLFKDNRKWVNYVISSGTDLRIKYPYFFLEIVRKGKILETEEVNNHFFVSLMHKLGSPIIVNDESNMTFAQPTNTPFDIHPEYLWVFHQIYNIYKTPLDHQTYKCEMIDYCNLRANLNCIEEYTDERCRYDPWTRSQDNDPNPCPFGQVWKTWGLMNECPKSIENEA